MSMASNSHPSAVAGAAKSPTDKSYRPAAEDTVVAENERKNYKSILMENPFVPVGLAATLGALGYGVYQLRTGNQAMSQKMMRLRVGAQAFTVLALLVGAEYASRTFSGNDVKSNSS